MLGKGKYYIKHRAQDNSRENLMSQPTGKNVRGSMSGLTCIRILIADDRPRVRQSLKALLTALRWGIHSETEIPIEIVGEANSGTQVLELVQALHPDVVVLDLPIHNSKTRASNSASKLDGLAAIQTIKSRWPIIRVVVLTMYATNRSAVLLAGADAFLLKGCSTGELLDAVMPTAL